MNQSISGEKWTNAQNRHHNWVIESETGQKSGKILYKYFYFFFKIIFLHYLRYFIRVIIICTEKSSLRMQLFLYFRFQPANDYYLPGAVATTP